LTRGYGVESRGVTLGYQAQMAVLGAVLPSNSPGVNTLWLPVIPLQIGLALKPGSQEPWTPYRLAASFFAAGVPREAISIYPGRADIGAEIASRCARAVVFGNSATVERYRGNPRVRVHGPGFSKILLGDDVVDDWEKYLDLMVESICGNAGRGCINCSSIWASRHTKAMAAALAERMGPIDVKAPEDPTATLAAFTGPGQAQSIQADILAKMHEAGAEDMTVKFGARLVEQKHAAYLRPWVVHCDSAEHPIAKTEYLFPFVTVAQCAQAQMIEALGPTLVCTAITHDTQWERQLLDAVHIDRLNLGPIPTTRLDWCQPHEGNLMDFLFRSRALQCSGLEQS
jgi:acyl-CoA reductase-like NAD-dependent aldehyde dehydrogenase